MSTPGRAVYNNHLATAAATAIPLVLFATHAIRRYWLLRGGPHMSLPAVSKKKQRNEKWMKSEVKVASCEAGYRRLVRSHVRRGDTVLELGCHCGTTTVLARSLTGKSAVLGIDTSEFNIAKARREHADEGVVWELADATDTGAVRRAWLDSFGSGRTSSDDASSEDDVKVSVILLDISGSRQPGLLVELVGKYERVFMPRLFIVKSYKLFSFISRTTTVGGGARWYESEDL
eukprot:gnl/TRDRNA2_/TRDRNA2_58343_c0_seq1.p1 gnl/TRDRNA2_/TRDRNA2_58343_c0~~gnl/TRDRNA2_/TRDRNA2_58343_c0_seq1.p1  ORF type:complete len:232 (-),score=24.14 gnl/TRDRNA2_/TRDRNA2_58343_c0_seq1:355-1050(-)